MAPIVAVPGASLGFDLAGPADAPALLFVHAGIATRAMWDPQFAELAADHRVIRYDTRGYGASPGEPVPYSEVDDLVAVLDAAGVSRAVVVGASRGGRFAVDAALAHPDRVSGLVLVCAGLGGMDGNLVQQTPAEQELEEAWELASEAQDVDALVRIGVELWAIGSRDAGTTSADFIQRAIELSVGATHWDFAGTPLDPDRSAADHLDEIRVPALVVIGEHDESYSLVAAELLTNGIPGAVEARFPDSAHLPSVEHPERFTALLRDFLTRNKL